MSINTTDLIPGEEYNLFIESIDSAFKALALKTDTIKIVVLAKSSEALAETYPKDNSDTQEIGQTYPKGYSDTLAYFVTILEQKSIISGKSEKWILPDIETNG